MDHSRRVKSGIIEKRMRDGSSKKGDERDHRREDDGWII